MDTEVSRNSTEIMRKMMRVGFNFWDVHELITLKVKSKIPN